MNLFSIFKPAPAAAVQLTNPAEIASASRYWEKRVLVSSIIGYAIFYFVRKNLGIAMPVMEANHVVTKSDFGLFLTLHGLLYGVSKFANGFLGDRCNARVFMAAGLVVSALLNIFFGLSTAVIAFGVIWMLNGWFQGMGFPPCARLMTHWFPPNKLAMKMSIWNISHSVGAGLVVVMCGYLLKYFNDWRLCFFVPAGIALACVVFLWFWMPDTPPSVGLPEVEGTETKNKDGAAENFWDVAVKYVFSNPYIWLISFANFFVYVIRYAVLDWSPTMLTQAKHIELAHAGWMVFTFEMCGIAGALTGGWLTDRFLGGRAIRAGGFFMAMAGVSILLFWKVAGESKLLNTVLLGAAGFFIYGPQCLIGIAAANLATKRAAATGVGLTGLFGYASTVLSGWGLGKLVQARGWDAGFQGMVIVASIGTVLFAMGWRAKAHGYDEPERVR